MIPKTIHYCWFGRKPVPDNVEKNIKSWKKYCPDYEIIQWNEDNYDVKKIDYTSQAYERKKYAFVSDFARLDIVNEYGGIYLDTDVELIKPLDDLIQYDSFFGLEEVGRVNTGLGFGSEKNSAFVRELKEQYNGQMFIVNGVENLKTCIDYAEPVFSDLGLIDKDETQYFNQSCIAVFATDVFCPQSLETGKTTITGKTISIHHYDSSWKKHPRMSRYFTKYKIRIRKSVDKIFGLGTYNSIKKIMKK